jgi:AcrR family transcriptional regulator/catechol 2,3-dioxygenase-like lactoylglutathione lyase family enzyme
VAAATTVFLDRGYGGATVRAIATAADVSVPTVEALFGTKARILKAAIDVAISGDDEPVPVLGRGWTEAASAAQTPEAFLAVAAGVVGPVQTRSAGLVLAAFEGASTHSELAELSDRLVAQRAETAGWLVDGLTRTAALRPGCSREEAVDTLWVLMDPAVFDRLTRQRSWTVEQYEGWFARSARRLLTPDPRVLTGPQSQTLIAVRDVEASSHWYQELLGLRSDHGGPHYDRLLAGGVLVLQLHEWETRHDHGRIGDPEGAPGNGVLLWFGETADFDGVVARADRLGAAVVLAPHRNPPAGEGNGPAHREIWITDPDGYTVVVASPDGEAFEPPEPLPRSTAGRATGRTTDRPTRLS